MSTVIHAAGRALAAAADFLSPSDFFRRVNDAALARLDSWVTVLFPGARHQPGTGAFRITSRQLGRNLEGSKNSFLKPDLAVSRASWAT